MIEDRDFVPFTRTFAWADTSDCYVRPLLADDDELCTAYGVMGSKQITYLTEGGKQETGKSGDEIHALAMANLLARRGKPKWAVKEIGDVAVTFRSGDELVASDVLNAKGMRKLGAFFGSSTVYVGIPTLFSMVASADGALLAGLVGGMHDDARRDRSGPLSERVMKLTNGVPVGLYEVAGPAAGTDEGKLANAVARGVDSLTRFVARVKGDENGGSVADFWRGFKRQLGATEGKLAQIIAAAEQIGGEVAAQTTLETATDAAAAPAPPARKPAIAHLEVMAGAARAALSQDDYQRFARAMIGTTTALGQAGTGFFGIGRKLPESERYLVLGLTGVLGIDIAAAKGKP